MLLINYLVIVVEYGTPNIIKMNDKPGGPNNKTPLGGLLKPTNKSGRKLGRMTASCSVCFA